MPKVARVLSAATVKALSKKPGRYAVGGVPGLCLRVINANSVQWVLRVVYHGGRHDIGLGSYQLVDLSTAREEARKMHLSIRQGADVLGQRELARDSVRTQKRALVTFKQDALALHAVKSDEFKNAKHAAQWLSTLDTYAFPTLGSKAVSEITRDDVLKVLEPIWKEKTETATRVRQRIEQVLDYSQIKGHRDGVDNPARWKGGLDMLLPKPNKIKSVKHHAALPYAEMPAFMAVLRAKKAASARALEFAILTAARSGEVRLATWSEIDLSAKVWTVPAERMKAGKQHRVPLSAAAVELLSSLPQGKPADLVFASSSGKPMSDMTLSKLLKDMKVAAVPHGFRSTFKDYCREQTSLADEVSELCLAHVNSDATRAAYARSELLEQRRELLQTWSAFLG